MFLIKGGEICVRISRFVLALAALTGGIASQAIAGTVTCEQGSECVCVEYCDHVGGGVASNPDGSVTCHFIQAQDPKLDVKELNDNDWLLVLVPRKAAAPEKR